MRLRRMCCSGFSVLRCLGRARTLVAPTLLAFARRVAAPSQALKNAPTATFFTAPPPHPLHSYRVQMGYRRKNPHPTAEKHRQPRPVFVREPIPGRVWVSMLLRGRGGFFWPLAPQHASACEGCGGGRAMDTAEGVSLSACSEPYHGVAEQSEAQPVVVFARCERGPVTGTKVPLVKRST